MDFQHAALSDETSRGLLGPDSSSNIGVCLAITTPNITEYPHDRRPVLYLPTAD